MQGLQVAAPAYAALQAIAMWSIKLQVMAIPPHVVSLDPMSLPSPPQIKVHEPFPKTLPDSQVPAATKKSYGLEATQPELYNQAPLNHQLSSLEHLATQPIQLDRLNLGQQQHSSFRQHNKICK